MSTTLKQPILQGVAPKVSRVRLVIIVVGLLIALVLVSIVYRAGFSHYEERGAKDYQRRGEDYFTQGYFEDAKFELKISSRLGTPSQKTYTLMAKVDLALGDRQSAVTNFRRAVELEPEDAESRFAFALALPGVNRKEAIEELEAALDLRPDYVAARYLLARLLTKENRTKDAVDHYQVLAGLGLSKKQLSEVHVAMAKLLIKQKRRPRAQHLLQTAWYMDRKNDEAWRLIMEIGRGKGREDEIIGTVVSTSTISSRIVDPTQQEKLNDEIVEIRGTAKAKSGAVVQVEVTYDGGHSWHQAKPINGFFDQWVANINFPPSDGRRFVLYSRATGSAGLPERPRKPVTIVVDNTGPSVIRQLEPNKPELKDGWYAVSPKIDLATLESQSTIFYKWNKGDYRAYVSSLKAPVGANRLYYFTRDKYGNESPVKKLTVKAKIIKDTDPSG